MHEGEIYLFIIGSYYIAIWTERSIIHYSLFRKTKKLYLNVCETEKEQCQDNSTIIYFSFWFLGKMLGLASGSEWCLCWDFAESICLIIQARSLRNESHHHLPSTDIIQLVWQRTAVGDHKIRSRSVGVSPPPPSFINLQIREDCWARHKLTSLLDKL